MDGSSFFQKGDRTAQFTQRSNTEKLKLLYSTRSRAKTDEETHFQQISAATAIRTRHSLQRPRKLCVVPASEPDPITTERSSLAQTYGSAGTMQKNYGSGPQSMGLIAAPSSGQRGVVPELSYPGANLSALRGIDSGSEAGTTRCVRQGGVLSTFSW